MTPAELNDMVEGYQERMDIQKHLLAWHAANIMNASGNLKRPVTIKKLLKGEQSIAERQQKFNELMKVIEKIKTKAG